MTTTSGAFTAAGTTLGVSASAPATFDTAGYAALTFVDVAEITDYGTFGRVYNEITHNPVGSRATQKFKGSYNDGTITLTMAKDDTDAGQIVLLAALASDSDYYFEVELNNNDAGTSDTLFYFPAKVMSFEDVVGGVDSIVSKNVNLAISGSIIEVIQT